MLLILTSCDIIFNTQTFKNESSHNVTLRFDDNSHTVLFPGGSTTEKRDLGYKYTPTWLRIEYDEWDIIFYDDPEA